MRHAAPDDWLFALVSLQTQEGFLGAGNYGISRMNGGFACRPGVGIAPVGHWGERWRRDCAVLRNSREATLQNHGYRADGGAATRLTRQTAAETLWPDAEGSNGLKSLDMALARAWGWSGGDGQLPFEYRQSCLLIGSGELT